jgi:antitoxin VapB
MDDTTLKDGTSARVPADRWAEFFALMRKIEVPEDFMAERPMNAPPRERHLLR